MNQAPVESYHRFPYAEDVGLLTDVEQQIAGGLLADRGNQEALAGFAHERAQDAATQEGENHLGSYIMTDGSFVALDAHVADPVHSVGANRTLRVSRLRPTTADRPQVFSSREYTIPTQYQTAEGIFDLHGADPSTLPADMRGLGFMFGSRLAIVPNRNGQAVLETRLEGSDVNAITGMESNAALALRSEIDHGIGTLLEEKTGGNEHANRSFLTTGLRGRRFQKAHSTENDKVARDQAAEFRAAAFRHMDEGTGAIHKTHDTQDRGPRVGDSRPHQVMPTPEAASQQSSDVEVTLDPEGHDDGLARQFTETLAQAAPPTESANVPLTAAELEVEEAVQTLLARERNKLGAKVLGFFLSKKSKDEVVADRTAELRAHVRRVQIQRENGTKRPPQPD